METRLRQVLPRCQVHVLHRFAKIQIWDRASMPTENHPREQFRRSTCCVRVFCYNISQPCRGMTRKSHRAALNETLFERKRFQAGFLVFQAKTRGRRTSQGVEDTTTVHHQSSRNLSRFRLPVLQVQLSKQNFQAQAYVDSFIIVVCCLCFCCS